MNGLQWTAFLVVLLLCLFNAVALSELLTGVGTNHQALNIIIGSVNVLIGALAFLKDFFPVYRSPAMVPETFYPLRGLERAAAGIFHDLISRYFIALILFL
ncbi:MAG TPA: hypothetical protein VKA68_13785, partial [bacterium]|nr:hypothetical protein [bacterium]